MMPVLPLLKGLLWPAVDYALPPRCPGCGAIVGEDFAFCLPCWGGMEFLGEPCCARCGVPFPHEMGEGAECGGCMADPPPWDSARAVLAYGDVARTVALRLKYGRRIGLARLIARQMLRHVGDEEALIVPVPLHRWRLWNRGFNQSALIADHLGRLTGWPVDKQALRRVKRTAPLRGMNPKQRAKMVRGAFALGAGQTVKGRRILLIDDVHTSGATAAACAKMLKRGGATEVRLLCWARVLPDAVADSL
ncbi:ComF family protein [Sphingobium limneticum]|jgi:ComF family protein|uniref:ComF family protein n=1 Tax=Sphingobium limneticum TaxID=1007511 RepID=A0A5J5I6Q9_9SPHN|nr:ComF family protein [Sphingobium limneticum]KAA9016838.1 ComF family protein [Sphingobium limneticum]KAA9029817.1 ComF family protein [Sphingobium limneticum]